MAGYAHAEGLHGRLDIAIGIPCQRRHTRRAQKRQPQNDGFKMTYHHDRPRKAPYISTGARYQRQRYFQAAPRVAHEKNAGPMRACSRDFHCHSLVMKATGAWMFSARYCYHYFLDFRQHACRCHARTPMILAELAGQRARQRDERKRHTSTSTDAPAKSAGEIRAGKNLPR